MRKRFIYKITCLINNRIYIGSAYDVQKRFKDHMKGGNSHTDMFLDVQKYGKDHFKVELLETIKNGDGWTDGHVISNVKEKYHIDYYSNNYPDLIYNLFDKPSWSPSSDARRKKISEARMGMIFSPEHCRKISESNAGVSRNKGKNLSLEHIKKISENHADVSGDKHPTFKGYFMITFDFEPDIYVKLTGIETGAAFRTHPKEGHHTTGRLAGITFERENNGN